jgi:FTR1 family protein
MLSAFLISLREGLEAALVVGICLAYLRKTKRSEFERVVWYAVAAALLASLGLAGVLERFAWNRETLEGVLLLMAAVLLASMILWMRRVARSLRQKIENRLGGLSGGTRWATAGLFLFVFCLVLREGVETVLLLGAVALNTEGLLWLLGTGLGLTLAVALGLSFFKGALPIRLDRFFDATSIMLLLVAVQLTLLGLHELSEAQVIPSGPQIMRLLGPLVRNEVFFFVLLLATATWLAARELLYRHHAAVLPTRLTEADRRRLRWEQRKERRWMTATAATALAVLVLLMAEYVYARGADQLSPAVPVEAAQEAIRIPLPQVNDGTLHRFSWTQDGTTIRFIVVRRPDGQLVAALDACQICGPVGYSQEGSNVICKNCAAVIYIPSIGLPGGCNPVPLSSTTVGDTLIIPLAELVAGGRSFRSH